jgi:hypothetical protein
MRLSKSLIKSLEKAYGQYLNSSQYDAKRKKRPPPPPPKQPPKQPPMTKPTPYRYTSPNFLNNTVQQSNPNLELQEFQQAQQQLLQNQRMQQMYATTRNAGQMARQTTQQMSAVAPPISMQSNQPPTMRPQPVTTNYRQTSTTSNTTPKAMTTGQSETAKPTTSIEDTSPEPSTGASILGTTTKRYSGIRKSSKSTAGNPTSTNSYEYSSQYMYEGTGKVPKIPSTGRSIPRNQKYF